MTGLTTKQQARLTKAVKRARMLSLLPFINRDGFF
jgi:small subunit ribosomal protein S18